MSDVFNAIAEADRREILAVLLMGERAASAIGDDLDRMDGDLRELQQQGDRQ